MASRPNSASARASSGSGVQVAASVASSDARVLLWRREAGRSWGVWCVGRDEVWVCWWRRGQLCRIQMVVFSRVVSPFDKNAASVLIILLPSAIL